MITILIPTSKGGVSDYVDIIRNNLPKNNCEIISTTTKTDFSSNCIILHYSGYGYANRGAPLWLLDKMKKERNKIKSMGVFFHELYAFGPPFGSAFWLSPVQRHIARRLAEISDFWITNREGSAQWLRRFAGNKPHAVMPVFSNVGEMPAYSPKRLPRIVVFGSAALRLATYRAAGATLFSWVREQNLELHDIGPTINDPILSTSLKKEGVIRHGCLESDEVSKLLSDAMFGIVAYPIDYAAKSGVLAAYCAHGICPILISKNNDPVDGLVARINYMDGIPMKMIQKNLVSNIGAAAWHWYQPHRIMEHVATLNRLSIESELTN